MYLTLAKLCNVINCTSSENELLSFSFLSDEFTCRILNQKAQYNLSVSIEGNQKLNECWITWRENLTVCVHVGICLSLLFNLPNNWKIEEKRVMCPWRHPIVTFFI